MKIIKLIFVFMFSYLYGNCQDLQSKSVSAINVVEVILETGKYNFQILDVDVPKDIEDITRRFAIAVNSNSKWFAEYTVRHKNETPLPYDERLGITKEEYDKLSKKFTVEKDTKFKVVKTEFFEIIQKDNKIRFNGNGVLSTWNDVNIDLRNKSVLFMGIELPYNRETQTKENDPLYWHGYTWRRETGDAESMLKYHNSDYTLLEISVGTLNANKKPFLNFKKMVFENGQPKVKYQYFGYLDIVQDK
ncbi:MAG: hypothetical protein JST82_12175 [Bacteroidetes bacterium]|nr:hypothetical protein [Bacteroidota bacterium]